MNSKKDIESCDVLIIGSSMAGACLARQLKLEHPSFNIVVLEKKTKFDYWVGESTLESFWDYAVKYLDLGFYLDTNHLYKHGLRFFYDSPNKDLPIDQMSEVGRSWYHSTPAHQIDRKRFDEDLYKMNLELGIKVNLGCRVNSIEVDKENGHIIETEDLCYRARWLVDAAGFGSPLAKKFKLHKSNNDHHKLSCFWGRFKHIVNLDLLGDKDWRSRVHNTTRTLATTHFMYGHYWIWLIPINKELFSIGVTSRTDLKEFDIKNHDEFVAFLKSHKCLSQLLGDESELLDYSQLKNFSRQAEYSFSPDRWFLTGISAAMLDPLLSPGSALLADNNRMIGDLINTDLAGENRVFENKVKAYNAYSKIWLENFFLHIKGHYHDCFDRQRANFETLLMQWFGVVLPISMAESWGYEDSMKDEDFDCLEEKGMAMLKESCIHKVDHIVEEFEQYLKLKGLEYANNQGEFYDIEIDAQYTHNTRTEGAEITPCRFMEIEKNMVVVAAERCLERVIEIEQIATPKNIIHTVAIEVANNGLSITKAIEKLHKLKGTTKYSDVA